jgi:hypothetical protein
MRHGYVVFFYPFYCLMPDKCVVADEFWNFCSDVVEPRDVFEYWEKVKEFSIVFVLIPRFDWYSVVLL